MIICIDVYLLVPKGKLPWNVHYSIFCLVSVHSCKYVWLFFCLFVRSFISLFFVQSANVTISTFHQVLVSLCHFELCIEILIRVCLQIESLIKRSFLEIRLRRASEHCGMETVWMNKLNWILISMFTCNTLMKMKKKKLGKNSHHQKVVAPRRTCRIEMLFRRKIKVTMNNKWLNV